MLTKIIEIDMKQTRTITLRISRNLNDEIERIVREKGYFSKSDFIRDALNEFLSEFEKSAAVDPNYKQFEADDGSQNLVDNPNLVVIY